MPTLPGTPTLREPLFLFDGDCDFCRATVRVLRRRLGRFPVAVAHQDVDLASFGLTEADVADQAWLLTRRRHSGGLAAYTALLRGQSRASLRLLGHLSAIPPWSWAAGLAYAALGRIRHLLPGERP